MTRSLIGRDDAFISLERAVGAGRLVSLVGCAGVGKTALAQAFFEHRRAASLAVWVRAERVLTPADLAAVVAERLGVALGFARDPAHAVELVGRVLSLRAPELVVVDNVEQALPQITASLSSWVKEAARSRFLITSRQRLGLSDETVVELDPLSVEDVPRGGLAPAVELLIARARGVRAPFDLEDAALRPVLSQIARRLEGLPLALELAAARMDVLHPQQILDRLADITAPMHITLDRSFELLEDAERSALVQCSVFANGFSAEAAEAVVAAETGRSVMTALSALRNKSLLRPIDASDKRVRLGLFESVRSHASMQHEHVLAPARARHLAYFAALAARLLGQVEAGGDESAVAELAIERANLVAAFDHAMQGEQAPVVAAKLVEALALADRVAGPVDATVERCTAWLTRPRVCEDAASIEAEIRLLLVRAAARRVRGHLREAAEDAAQAQARLASDADGSKARAELTCRADLEQASVAIARGEWESGLAAVARAEERAKLLQSDALLARILTCSGAWLGQRYPRTPAAVEALERAVRIARRTGHADLLATTVENLGAMLYQNGDLDAGCVQLEEALARWTTLGRDDGCATCLGHLAAIDHEQGRLEQADSRTTQAASLFVGLGRPIEEARALLRSSLVALERGEDAQAAQTAASALDLLEPNGELREAAFARSIIAAALAWQRRHEEAQRQASLARAILTARADPWLRAASVLELHLNLARAVLDDAASSTDTSAAVAEVRRRVRPLLEGARAGAEHHAHDVRVLARTLEAALSRVTPPQNALLIALDGSWIQPPSLQRVELAKKPLLRKLVARLAEVRRARPGERVTVDELIGAGWGDERIRYDSAKNRLHVALNALRNLGLRTVLQTGQDGWRLDPDVPLWTAAGK